MDDNALIVKLVEDFEREAPQERPVEWFECDPKTLRRALDACDRRLQGQLEFTTQAGSLVFVPLINGLDVGAGLSRDDESAHQSGPSERTTSFQVMPDSGSASKRFLRSRNSLATQSGTGNSASRGMRLSHRS